MATYYDQIAPSYDELHGSEQLEKIHRCMHIIEPREGDRLLDVGCGTGISTEPWKCERHGIDPSEELIRIAKKKRDSARYTVASAEEIPYPDKHFDILISITAIQNFQDISKAIREMKRVLKDGGLFIVTTLKDSPKVQSIENAVREELTVEEIHEGRIDKFFIGKKHEKIKKSLC